MPENSTTPRKLTVVVEMDVTEGPRLRRGMTKEIMQFIYGLPVAKAAVKAARDALKLEPSSVTVQVQWGYVWMDSQAVITPAELNALSTV